MKKIIIPIFMLLPLMTAQAQTVLTEEQQLEQAQKQLEAAKKALEGTDIDAIKAAGEKLTEASQKLAQIVYSTTDEAAAGQAGSAPAGDDVVDADYEVVDDDK